MAEDKKEKIKAATKEKGDTKKVDQEKDKCFVLMPFHEPVLSYFSDIIEPTIKKTDLVPITADSLFTSASIIDYIWKMIQEAKVLVAILTERNPNVFYELGLAHALGKPVILVSATMDDVPFDLRPYRVIIYNYMDPKWGDKLETDIEKAIFSVLGDASQAVPSTFRRIVNSQAPIETELESRISKLEDFQVKVNQTLAISIQDYSKLTSGSFKIDPHSPKVHGMRASVLPFTREIARSFWEEPPERSDFGDDE